MGKTIFVKLFADQIDGTCKDYMFVTVDDPMYVGTIWNKIKELWYNGMEDYVELQNAIEQFPHVVSVGGYPGITAELY